VEPTLHHGIDMNRHVLRALLVGGLAGCGPGAPGVDARWARWFTFGAIQAAQAAPDGASVAVVVESTADAVGPGAPPATLRRGVFVLDDQGGLHGRAALAGAGAVAIDADGAAYALVPDVGREGPAPRCRLMAVDADDATRWERPWPLDDDGAVECAAQPLFAGDRLVVRGEVELTAVSRGGSLLWRSTLPSGCGALKWRDQALWCAQDPDEGGVTIVRCDPADGACRSIVLDDAIDQLLDFDVSADAIVVRDCTFEGPSQDCRIAGFDRDGHRRWSTPRNLGAPSDAGPFVVASTRGHWLVGTHRSPRVDETSQREISLRHLTSEGRIDLRLRRRFVDAPGDALAREACPDGGDVSTGPEGGSAVRTVLRLDDDGFLVVGEHGCRDGFVLALQVRP
jgi:hypothetical protein